MRNDNEHTVAITLDALVTYEHTRPAEPANTLPHEEKLQLDAIMDEFDEQLTEAGGRSGDEGVQPHHSKIYSIFEKHYA
jgi:hypothetical protein